MNPEAKKTLRRLVIAVPLMFAFGFALVPLYNVFCEVTGINGKVFNQIMQKSWSLKMEGH
jgi:cytochrome c oxidase assembly protein subunit 11